MNEEISWEHFRKIKFSLFLSGALSPTGYVVCWIFTALKLFTFPNPERNQIFEEILNPSNFQEISPLAPQLKIPLTALGVCLVSFL